MKKTTLLCILFFIVRVSTAQQNFSLQTRLSELNNAHDIHLSPWGPYSKKYAGISHIYDIQAGMRFDFSVLPGFYRNKILIPNVQFESGYFPWEASSNLDRYTYRYELEWKDKIYVDVTYSIIDSLTVIAAIKCVNNTALSQNLSLNLVYGIEYPDIYPVHKLLHSANALWINAADYSSLDFASKTPKDNLVTDGWMKGEIRDAAFLDGSAIAWNFGKAKGDKIRFSISPKQHFSNGTLTVIYRMKKNTRTALRLSGPIEKEITLEGTGTLSTIDIPLSSSNSSVLQMESMGGEEIELNGILLTPAGEMPGTKIVEQIRHYTAQSVNDAAGKKLLSKYPDIPLYYGFSWDGNNDFKLRQIKNDELDIFFRRLVHNHTDSVLMGNNKGDYSNVFIRPVELLPLSEKTMYCIISTGNRQQVKERLDKSDSLKNALIQKEKTTASLANTVLPQGQKYLFSQKMLQATVLTDLVYPIYTQRNYIRHFTPGKWWNSLYTWDLGFIALGLNEINLNTAAECLNAYTTPAGSQSAFIHHGSPVPTQFYAFQDLWNKTQSKEALQYFYPRLKQYYEFLAGRKGSSTTGTLQSGLLKTWDYFYNSGGWDDYPAQVAVHSRKAEQSVTPVINTAQQIRIAKIMRLAADALGEKKDIINYDHDIKELGTALQKYSWNVSSGYFSYTTHDAGGKASGKFLNDDGIDYNMGLDGVYPLVAGICTPSQQQSLTGKIFSPKNLWTPSGISVVDQSAPYYKTDGYWNGSVWMPHQWFIWKTMLDLGKPDLAFKIAEKGLDVYSRETDRSYYTFEHFLAKSGQGAGWHQFSGLSTPVLCWFAAYYKPGTVTTGFEVWIKQQAFGENNSMYKADIGFDQATIPQQRAMLVCLNPAYKYAVSFNDKAILSESPYEGFLQIYLPASNKSGTLVIKRIQPLQAGF